MNDFPKYDLKDPFTVHIILANLHETIDTLTTRIASLEKIIQAQSFVPATKMVEVQ